MNIIFLNPLFDHKPVMTSRRYNDRERTRKKDQKHNIQTSLLQYRFATWKDKVLLVVGSLCALVHGAAQPLMLLVYSMMTDTFVNYEREVQLLVDGNNMCANGTIVWENGTEYKDDNNNTVYCG